MSRSVPFTKIQSIGNDFVLMMLPDVSGLDLSSLTQRICERRFGVGADSSLFLQVDSRDHLTLLMFNADGTPDFCGNGLRCAIHHAHAQGWIDSEVHVLHGEQSVRGVVHPDGLIETTLGAPRFDPADIPLASNEPYFLAEHRGWEISCLTTGSAHTVVFVPELPSSPTFETESHFLEHDPLFPERTSIMWTQVIGRDHLRLRIWERGVGETLGCGSGSAAAAATYLRREGRGGRVQVENPGGTLLVEADSWDAPLTLHGRVESRFSGLFWVS